MEQKHPLLETYALPLLNLPTIRDLRDYIGEHIFPEGVVMFPVHEFRWGEQSGVTRRSGPGVVIIAAFPQQTRSKTLNCHLTNGNSRIKIAEIYRKTGKKPGDDGEIAVFWHIFRAGATD
jgi:hypothetical protein